MNLILQLMGVIATSLLIWFLGPLISIADVALLAATSIRIALIAIVFIIWSIVFYLKKKKQTKAAEQLIEGLEQVEDGSTDRVDEEVDMLQQDFNEAIALLKNSNGGKLSKQLLYELPWYIIIGPPGSGKTTALVNSGLKFPLADKIDSHSIKGVGGTRNCDWWFTNDAILIDTAGRYTTQDSHESVDKGGWLGFLRLLKDNRPRRPVNGAVVAMSLADFLLQSDEELKLHAKAVRNRIQELDEKLGVEIPIYMMFTKCDLVAGFSEFFEGLGFEQRKQVWGHTFDCQMDREVELASFQQVFQALIQRLDDRSIEIMQDERDGQNRALIFGFPRQMEALQPRLVSFLNDVFSINRYQKPSFLRGFYFTSGTQEGSPIDRVMGGLANSFGLDRQTTPVFSGQGRSYFIQRLLNDVVFNEAELVGIDPKRERIRHFFQLSVYVFSAIALVSLSLFWFISYSKNSEAIEKQNHFIKQYKNLPEQLRWQLDFKQLQVRMDELGAASTQVFTESDSKLMKLGLYQGEKLALPAKQGYERFLEKYFLPAIRYRFEERLQDAVSDNDELLYELLKVYLMLNNPEKQDFKVLKNWIVVDWELEFSKDKQTLDSLKKHLDYLVKLHPESIKLNDGLISSVRRVLTQVPLAYQVYSRIKSETLDNAYAITTKQVLGHFGDRVFINTEGELAQLRVPGLYTAEGYENLFKKHTVRIMKEAVEQDWVLNRTETGTVSINELRTLQSEIQLLYIKEYIRYWDWFLSKLEIRETLNSEDTIELIGYLSGKDSPLKKLLIEVEKNTALSRLENALLGQASQSMESRVSSKLRGSAIKAFKSKASGSLKFSVNEIDLHFEKLNQLVYREDNQVIELDQVLSRFARVYAALIDSQNKALFSNRQGLPDNNAALSNELQLIKYESNKLHELSQGWIKSVVNKVQGEVTNNLQKQMSQKWKDEVYSSCKNTLEGRYPFNKGSRREVNLTDFSQFFSKQGIADDFFNQFLKGNIETVQGQWKLNALAEKNLFIKKSSIRYFQKSALIRDKYFKYHVDKPSIQFSLKPIDKTEDIAQVMLEIDGQMLVFDDKPIRAKGFVWPGGDVGSVSISFEYIDGRKQLIYQADGSWALFRLLDVSVNGKIHNTSDRVTINLSAGLSHAKFELYAGGGINPFAVDEIRHFRCPRQL